MSLRKNEIKTEEQDTCSFAAILKERRERMKPYIESREKEEAEKIRNMNICNCCRQKLVDAGYEQVKHSEVSEEPHQ